MKIQFFPPNVPLGTRGSDITMIKKVGGVRCGRARNLPRSSRLRFSDIFENFVQQYGTSAFGPSKTRRKIDFFFENRQKRLVKLTSVFEHVRTYCKK